MDDAIKISFSRVKEDIYFLNTEISSIKSELNEIKSLLNALHEELNLRKLKEIANNSSSTDTQTQNPIVQHINQSNSTYPTHNPTLPQEIRGLKNPISGISIGNEGVPTDSQTNQQTNQQMPISKENNKNMHFFQDFNSQNSSLETNIQKASEILDSLDRLKKEIRLKFKRITNQEMTVFSTIYTLEEQDPDNTTYKKVASSLKLSESSIRDYVQRLINKGIPIKKQKINNKTILLSVSQELKKIATLNTIIQLREL